jgi:hypothetical protein
MKLLKTILISIGLTIIISIILFVARKITLDYIVLFITNLRGTSHYQGETWAKEFITVFFWFVLPSVFVLSFFAVFLVRRKGTFLGKP